MNKLNILVFPCGSEVAFEIHNALKYNVNFEVYGASSQEDHGRLVFRNYIGGMPFIQEEDFIPKLNEVIEKHKIGIIFPTHDTVSLFLAEHRDRINTKLAVPEYETAMICRNKKLTYDLFKDYSFNPKIYHPEDNLHFPLFLKPNIGEGGKNTKKISTHEDLQFYNGANDENLLVEYLPGKELTIDCFTDRHGILRFMGPRSRDRVFGGISVRSKVVNETGEIRSIAETINDKLKLRGLWFFQLKEDKTGKWKLLEVSARTSSTMGLYRNLGINFHLLTAYDLMDLDVEMIMNDSNLEVERAFVNRFSSDMVFDTVYIDFDDTLTNDGEINEFVMMFVYQQARKKRKVILITRHEYDIYQTLKNLKVDPGIFDDIITLNWDESKAEAIKNTHHTIFIDNAYQERKEVKNKLNIPVFDVDAIQSLIDWRE
jgi:hypothetical protein